MILGLPFYLLGVSCSGFVHWISLGVVNVDEVNSSDPPPLGNGDCGDQYLVYVSIFPT